MTDIASVAVRNKDGNLGTLWEPNPGEVVFTGDLSVSADVEERILSLVETTNELGLQPAEAFSIIGDLAQKFDSSVVLENQTLVAAATPTDTPDYEEKSPYTITADDNNNVLGLIWIDPDGNVSVRENGDWDVPTPDDTRFYDNSFYFVNENAVQLYDRLVQDGNTPVLDDFDEVSVD